MKSTAHYIGYIYYDFCIYCVKEMIYIVYLMKILGHHDYYKNKYLKYKK